MSPHGARFAHILEDGDYLYYLKENALEGWSMRGPDLYTTKTTVQSYFLHQRQRLETLLERVLDSKEFEDIDCDHVFEHYLIVLTILVWIDRPDFLPRFVRHRLSDERLPFDVPPSEFPPLANGSFFTDFRDAQWRFCPFVFRIGEKDCKIAPERIIPIRSKKKLRRRPPATVWKVVLHKDCDPFQASQSLTDSTQSSRNTYIFKQFTGSHATASYKKELKAFVHLYRHHRAQLGNTIIGFHGSFVHGDAPVLILEFAEYGSLEDFYTTHHPPQGGQAIINLWRAILQLYKAISAIHNIASPKDEERFHSVLRGWHQDIKPGNILVTRGRSGAEDDYAFRLADLGTTHFALMMDATEEELEDADAGGTRAYGAPECYRTTYLPEEMSIRVGQAVDIWSFGAVLSEFGVWLVCGLVELNQYRQARRTATELLFDPGCFHDGHGRLLDCVKCFNDRAIECRRMGDHATKKIIQRLIEGMLYVERSDRPTAQYLVHTSGDILDQAQLYLNQRQSSSPAAANNTPPEKYGTHALAESVPVLSLPTSIETSSPTEEARSSSPEQFHSSPPDLSHAESISSESPDVSAESEVPGTPTPSQSRSKVVGRTQAPERRSHKTGGSLSSSQHCEWVNSRKERMLHSDDLTSDAIDVSGQDSVDPGEGAKASSYLSAVTVDIHAKEESAPARNDQESLNLVLPKLTLDALATYRHHMKSGLSNHATLPGDECLSPLAAPARDFVFLIDDSASMRKHKQRITSAVDSMSWLLKEYDDNGIDMYFMRRKQTVHAKRRSSSDLHPHLVTAMMQASGTSDITLRLGSLLHDYCKDYKEAQQSHYGWLGQGISRLIPGVRAQQKGRPLTIYIFTNAIWQEASDPTNIIVQAAKRLDELDAPWYQVGIQFISVGASANNQRKLDRLDQGLGLSRDMVDTEPIDGNVYKMLLGPIDRKWDADSKSSWKLEKSHFRRA